MTAAQEKALDDICHLMREHFDGGCFVVTAVMENDDSSADIRVVYHGGFCTALGLLHEGIREISKTDRKKDNFG